MAASIMAGPAGGANVIDAHNAPGLMVQRVAGCPACAVDTVETAFQADAAARERFRTLDRRRYGGWMAGWEDVLSLSVRRCRSCGHLWHADRPDQASLDGMYRARAERRGASRGDDPGVMAVAHRHLRHLRALCSAAAPRLLDYGAGRGLWSRVARDVGFDVYAVEPSMMRFDGLPVAQEIRLFAALDEIATTAFDAVNLEQVLEHVADPFDTLCAIRRVCGPHALLRISVPNVGAAQRRPRFWSEFPFGGSSHLLSPYEHLHGFSGHSLRRLLRRAGFAEITLARVVTRFPSYAAKRAVGFVMPAGPPTFVIARVAEAP